MQSTKSMNPLAWALGLDRNKTTKVAAETIQDISLPTREPYQGSSISLIFIAVIGFMIIARIACFCYKRREKRRAYKQGIYTILLGSPHDYMISGKENHGFVKETEKKNVCLVGFNNKKDTVAKVHRSFDKNRKQIVDRKEYPYKLGIREKQYITAIHNHMMVDYI